MLEIIDPKCFMVNCKFIDSGLSYEKYLIEILNWSSFFRKKSDYWVKYHSPVSEAHGEADAISDDYEIDFKVLINEELMNGLIKNKPIVDKSFIRQGFIFTKDNPNPSPIPKKNIICDINELTEEDIVKKSFKNDTIKHFIKNIEKDKNLFLYYPYEFKCDDTYHINVFLRLFTQVFKVSLEYRSKILPLKETYLCIKVNENFLIFEWVKNEFVYRDVVNEALCPTYSDYKLYAFF